MHAFWEIASKADKTELERALVAAVTYLSVREGFTDLTPEDIYDKLIDKRKLPLLVNEGLNPRGPHYF